MPGRWQHFPHGADVGVRGIGRSLAEAFAEAARAMTAAAVDLDAVGLQESRLFVPVRTQRISSTLG